MTEARDETSQADLESLFVWGGGRFSKELERLRLASEARLHAGRVAVGLAALTWLPLWVLSLAEGVAWGDRVAVPFLKDLLPHGQFLVSVPVLIFGDILVGRRLGRAMAELRRSDVLAPEDTPALETLLTRAVALWRGGRVHWVLLLVTLLTSGLSFWGVEEWLTGGWQSVDGRMTLAGGYYLLFSASVLRFLTLQWVWRLLLWAWVLWRTARLNLQPRAIHPDRAGGLAFLGTTQASFGVLVFALGVQLSCLIADAVAYDGADLMTYRAYVGAFVVLVVSVLLLPLLRFAPVLMRARGEGLAFLTGSGYDGATHLERRLRTGGAEEFPNDAVSGVADFGALYDNARAMKPLPLELRHIAIMVASALLPFSPLVFLVVPANEVFQTLIQLVL